MIYKLTLGDWSEDGHCISKVNDDDNNYTGKKLQYKDPHIIWCRYDEDDMSKVAYDILNKAGCFDGIYVEETDEGRYYIEEREECARLIMNFISLSIAIQKSTPPSQDGGEFSVIGS